MLMNQVQTQVEATAEQLVPPDAGSSKPEDNVAGDRDQPENDGNSLHIRESSFDRVGRHRRKGDSSLGRRDDDDERSHKDARTRPTRLKSALQPASPSTPKTSSSANLPGASGACSRPTEAPTLSGPILARGGVRKSDEGVTESDFNATWQRFGMDPGCNDLLGTKGCQLGQYTNWCLSRLNSLGMPVLDYAKYSQVRRQMEAQLQGL